MKLEYGNASGKGLGVILLLDALRWQENERRKRRNTRKRDNPKKGA